MKKEKLNRLANEYVTSVDSRKNEIFKEIYTEFTKWLQPMLSKLSKSLLSDESEVRGLYEDTLLKVLTERFKSGDFTNLLSKCLKDARIGLYRSNKSRRQREADAIETMGNELLRSGNANSAETEFLRKKKEAETAKLIDFFIRTSKSDTTTTAIVEAILSSPQNEKYSLLKIAKSLELHHQVVKRKLNYLVRQYDANQYGEHNDYLAV